MGHTLQPSLPGQAYSPSRGRHLSFQNMTFMYLPSLTPGIIDNDIHSNDIHSKMPISCSLTPVPMVTWHDTGNFQIQL